MLKQQAGAPAAAAKRPAGGTRTFCMLSLISAMHERICVFRASASARSSSIVVWRPVRGARHPGFLVPRVALPAGLRQRCSPTAQGALLQHTSFIQTGEALPVPMADAAMLAKRAAKRSLELFEPAGPDALAPDYSRAQRIRVASLVADEYSRVVAPQVPPAARAATATGTSAGGVAGGGATTMLLENAKAATSAAGIASSGSSSSSAPRSSSTALAVISAGGGALGAAAGAPASTIRRLAAQAASGATAGSAAASQASGTGGAVAAVASVVSALDQAGATAGVAAGGSQAGMRHAAALAEAARTSSRVASARSRPRQLAPPRWHAPWKTSRVISGPGGWVRCVAVDPSNEFFVTGAADRSVVVWDLATGQRKLTLTGHISTVRAAVLSPRHPYLFTAGEDKKVMCWDLEHNKVIRHYHGHLSGVYSLAMHPTLDVLMSGGRDAVCRVWDMRTRSEVHVLAGHTNAVASIATQSTDPQVITGSMDATVRLWDLAAGKSMATLTHHSRAVRALCNGRGPGGAGGGGEYSFVSGAADGIRKWHAGSGQLLFGMRGHETMVHSLACNDDGVLFSGADDGGYRMWDVATGHCFQAGTAAVQSGSLDSEAAIFCSAFDMTGARLITGHADKTVRIWQEDPDATPETHPVDVDAFRREVRRAEEPGAM